MFFIMGFGNKKSQPIGIDDGSGRRYIIFYIYDYFSLFFIPLFRFGKQYYVATEGVEREISREEYEQMKQGGKVDDKYKVDPQSHHGQTYQDTNATKEECANAYCPVCKKELEKEHLYCPYCGQKQPTHQGKHQS